ncbi:MAG: Na+/H+ antiporter NhaC family protein [Candidatus Wallbacteria bacterium]|nr:Na+/H+ antiporter NhaC family protein [Candidatus Wallbacteria bacterium]
MSVIFYHAVYLMAKFCYIFHEKISGHEVLMEHSFLSLLPALTAIVLAITTRKVLPSLFFGVWLGAAQICDWNPFLGFLKLFEGYIVPSLGSKWNATVILYGAAFGGLIALVQKTGGALALGEFFARKARTSRMAQFYTSLFGVAIFFDDYFNCLTIGAVMRPICDRLKVAREKLAFILDSTAAPVCLLVPVSTWVVYVMGLIGKELEAGVAAGESPYLLYLKTIPLNFYSWAALLGTLAIVLTGVSFGPMRKAEERVEKTGKLLRDGALPPVSADLTGLKPVEGVTPRISDVVLPIGVMLAVLPFMFLYTGGYFKGGVGFVKAIGDSKGALSILISAVVGGASAMILGCARRSFTLNQAMDFYIEGMKGMFVTYMILILAWAIGSVTKDLGTAKYVSSLVVKTMTPSMVPLVIFLFGAAISFTTGTSYGTFAILTPIAIPVAISMGLPVEHCMAAVLSGGIFGDHCSPVSDTTILSSTGAACDHMDHVVTQMPYALLFASAAIIGFAVLGFSNSCAAGLVATGAFMAAALAMVMKWK